MGGARVSDLMLCLRKVGQRHPGPALTYFLVINMSQVAIEVKPEPWVNPRKRKKLPIVDVYVRVVRGAD